MQLDGGNPETFDAVPYVGGQPGPLGLALGGGYVYWSRTLNGPIVRRPE